MEYFEKIQPVFFRVILRKSCVKKRDYVCVLFLCSCCLHQHIACVICGNNENDDAGALHTNVYTSDNLLSIWESNNCNVTFSNERKRIYPISYVYSASNCSLRMQPLKFSVLLVLHMFAVFDVIGKTNF